MSRLLAAALLIASLLPALARPAAAVTEDELIAGAKAQIDTGCRCSTDACPKLKQLFSDYLAVLREAEKCVATRCATAAVLRLMAADEALDKTEGGLPDPARATVEGERPFLRLSLAVSLRAAQALTLADPAAKPPLRFDPEVDGPKTVELICINAPGACADARGTLDAVKTVRKKTDECEKKKCSFEELDAEGARAEGAMRSYTQASRSGIDTLTLFSLVRDAEQELVILVTRLTNERLAALEAGLGSLERGAAAFADKGRGDQFGLESSVLRLGQDYREASLGADRAASFLLDDRKTGIRRERLNGAAARLSAARARLLATEMANGLSPLVSFGDRAEASLSGGKKTAALATDARAAPTLIDRRTIPAPPPSSPKAPPILDRKPGLREIARDIFSDDPMKRADARHRSGLSYTVGDPSGRAGLVHGQTFPDTCAVVSQQEVLTALKLLPAGDPVKTEALLRDEALKRGFYNAGTPDAYTAELLIDRGVLVNKKIGTDAADLDAAVRRGGMVIANVDARYLWGIPAKKVLGHAIVIVGAEVDRFSGATLGYYVNDSGSDPPGHGRFVPLDKFREAWDAHTKSYAEVR